MQTVSSRIPYFIKYVDLDSKYQGGELAVRGIPAIELIVEEYDALYNACDQDMKMDGVRDLIIFNHLLTGEQQVKIDKITNYIYGLEQAANGVIVPVDVAAVAESKVGSDLHDAIVKRKAGAEKKRGASTAVGSSEASSSKDGAKAKSAPRKSLFGR